MGLNLEPKVFSVAQITSYIKNLFNQDLILSSLLVKGEISNFKEHSSGHLYFTLKDARAAIQCMMFAADAAALPFSLENGQDVIVCGRISIYEKTGQYQLYAEFVEPIGIGALQFAFEQTKERLAAEGLFDTDMKRELPKHPATIAIITSPTGAAVRDIIHVAKRRDPAVKLVLFPSLVQGNDAKEDLVRALKAVNRWGKADVIILGRGGGSMEDLWAFNEEMVARAIFASEIPVISAVGHETDFTIADFVSDMRAPTPSAAAEIATADRSSLIYDFERLSQRMKRAFQVHLTQKKQRFANLPEFKPEKFIAQKRDLLDQTTEKMQKAVRFSLTQKAQQFSHLCDRIGAASPLGLLERGYLVATDRQGHTVSSVAQVAVGDTLRLRLRDGFLDSTVTKRSERVYDEKETDL